MNTSELTNLALNWAVAKCEGVVNGDALDTGFILEGGYTPSTDWAQGGPIIEREGIAVQPEWVATLAYENDDDAKTQYSEAEGPTPLIAAMRCYVAARLGDTVDVPPELQ